MYACVQRFNMTENLENFWQLNKALGFKPGSFSLYIASQTLVAKFKIAGYWK